MDYLKQKTIKHANYLLRYYESQHRVFRVGYSGDFPAMSVGLGLLWIYPRNFPELIIEGEPYVRKYR